MENLQIKIIQETRCSIRDDDTTRLGWYMEEPLYTVSDGGKLGLMYNRKSRCIPFEPPHFEILLDCAWDDIRVIDAERCAYVIARAQGKCKVFCMVGYMEIIREDKRYHQNTFYITMTQIKDY